MNIVYGLVGLFIIIVVSIDILWTTLLIVGGGPLATRITSYVWKFLLRLQRVTKSNTFLSYGGLITIVINLLFWVVFIWLGWLLIFCADPLAVLHESSKMPADFSSRVYYTGYTLITLGIGDYVAGRDFWQLATVIASANGFILVTLSITYLLPIVSAVVQKRQLAAMVYSLGSSPKEILLNAWNGKDFGMLSQYFSSLTPQILEMGEKHLAYPILHCFHTSLREVAIAPNLVALDEALTILLFGVDADKQPNNLALSTLRKSITIFLATQVQTQIDAKNDIPPHPDFQALSNAGIALAPIDPAQDKIKEIAKRRRLLHALVINDGWNWKNVIDPEIVDPEKLAADPTLMRHQRSPLH